MLRRNVSQFAVVVLLMLSLVAVVVPRAAAQNNSEQTTGNGLQVSPATREFTLDPGESASYEINVTNITGGQLRLEAVVNDFEQRDGEKGEPQLILDDRETAYSIKGFIKPIDGLTLKPGEQRTVPVAVTVPEDTAAGAYYGAVRFGVVSDRADGQTVVSLSAGVGALIFINVTGDITDNLALEQLAGVKGDRNGTLFENGPVNILARLRNTGTSYLKPIGRVIVKDWRGNTVQESEFNPQQRSIILPGTIRRFEIPVDSTKRLLGKYTIELSLTYGEGGGNVLTASSSYWVLPWKWLLLGLLVLVGGGFALFKSLKGYNRRVVAKSRR